MKDYSDIWFRKYIQKIDEMEQMKDKYKKIIDELAREISEITGEEQEDIINDIEEQIEIGGE